MFWSIVWEPSAWSDLGWETTTAEVVRLVRQKMGKTYGGSRVRLALIELEEAELIRCHWEDAVHRRDLRGLSVIAR